MGCTKGHEERPDRLRTRTRETSENTKEARTSRQSLSVLSFVFSLVSRFRVLNLSGLSSCPFVHPIGVHRRSSADRTHKLECRVDEEFAGAGGEAGGGGLVAA